MANGILKQLNKSLEVNLRDGLDGLEDFTLQMAYAGQGAQFKILSIGEATEPKMSLPTKPVSLKVVDTGDTNINTQPATQRQRRA